MHLIFTHQAPETGTRQMSIRVASLGVAHNQQDETGEVTVTGHTGYEFRFKVKSATRFFNWYTDKVKHGYQFLDARGFQILPLA